MTSKRYLGNIITDTPTAPAGPYENSVASGVWSLAEQKAYSAAGLWPTAGNAAPRALFAGGFGGGVAVNTIDTLLLASAQNATDFGDLTLARYYSSNGGPASSTRGVFGGGADTNGDRTNVIDYVTFASTGNAADFGDISTALEGMAGCSSSTRGIFAGGAS